MHSVETVLCILNLDLFPGKPYAVGMIVSQDTRQRHPPAARHQPRNHKGKRPISLDHSASIQPFFFFFSFSVWYAINYMKYKKWALR